MKTIVFAKMKGGTGATTLAFNLAIEIVRHNNTVFLADMDPQKSLETFCQIRGGSNPMLLKGVGSVSRASADLLKSKYARDFLIADLPGSFVDVIADTVKAADCVVIPMQPSPVDLLAQEEVFDLVRDLGKSSKAIIALNRMDGRTRVVGLRERLPFPVVEIRNRIAYSRALVAGKAGTEIDRECAAEISALWTTIRNVLGG